MKSATLLSRTSRTLLRRGTTRQQSALLPPKSGPRHLHTHRTLKPTPLTQLTHRPNQSHTFSTTSSRSKGLQPGSEDPEPPNPTPHDDADPSNLSAASLSDAEYHEISDQYMNTLQHVLEEKAEDHTSGLEVEYSAGVLNLTTPTGVYVVNKQPPNKQIWLSSPVSGPKRFDWVVGTGGQDVKEGLEAEVMGDDGTPGGGRWVYLRDGSSLSGILKKEVGVEVVAAPEGDA